LKKIASIYGVSADGHLAKPSEGGFSVITEGGRIVTMWTALAYVKAEDLPNEYKDVETLTGLLKECRQAFTDYEMTADVDAPRSHIDLMNRIDAAIAGEKAVS
jgi:hypothetical protein